MIISFSYWLFGTFLAFTPLAFGTSELWSMTYAQAFILCGFTCYLLALGGDKQRVWHHPPGLVPLILFCFYVLAQLAPLPPGMIRLFSPTAGEIYSNTVWLIEPGAWMPLSLAPKTTLLEFFRFSSCVVLYIFTIQLLADRVYLSRTIFLLAALASGIALLAILQKFTSPDAIYWMREIREGSPMGPWVNRNHFAGFMEMALPVLIVLFLYYRPKVRYKSGWRKKITMFFAVPESNLHILLGFGAILIGVAIFLSLSRSGITGMSLSLILLIFFLEHKNYGTKNFLFVLTLVLAVVLGVCWFGWQPIIERFDHLVDDSLRVTDARPEVWLDVLRIIRDFPLFGAGFGSFLAVYPAYRTLPGHAIFDHAHNDYLELFTDGGIIGAVLVCCFLYVLFRDVRQIVLQRRDPYAQLLTYGVFCGLFAMLVHSVTDFNLHIGANGFYFFFYCALLVSVASTRRLPKPRHKFLGESRPPWVQFAFAPSFVLLALSLFLHSGMLTGQFMFSRIPDNIAESNVQQLKTIRTQIDKALESDPREAAHHFTSGIIRRLERETTSAAWEDFLRAVKLAPLECRNLQWLAYATAKPETADQLYRNSVRYNPAKVQCNRNYIERLFFQHRHGDGVDVLQAALALNPGDIKFYFDLLDRADIPDDDLGRILPKSAAPYIHYAVYLWNSERKIKALNIYLKGLELVDSPTDVSSSHFRRGYQWSMELRRSNQAFEILKKAVLIFPRDPRFHELLGDFFLNREISYRAVEEYNKALALDPNNRRVEDKANSMSKIINP